MDTPADRSNLRELARILRAKRESIGLSAREVAERANVSTSYVGMVERSERRPTISNLVALLGGLEIKWESSGPDGLILLDEDKGEMTAVRFKSTPRHMAFARPRAYFDSEDGSFPVERFERVRQREADYYREFGELLGELARNEKRLEGVYRQYLTGTDSSEDSEMPDSDVMLGELATAMTAERRLLSNWHQILFPDR